ncbi:hypothetical protein BHM03_00058892 [Ensete ventricosum]|nr:hypothetical protein BHM03_00058892 [Ensete ventricosum]
MPKTATSEFPLSLAFGTEVVLLAEVVFSTLRVENYEEGILEEGLRANLDLVKERRVEAHLRALAYKNAVARLYNRKGQAGTKLEGPYRVTNMIHDGTYLLATREGAQLPIEHSIYLT